MRLQYRHQGLLPALSARWEQALVACAVGRLRVVGRNAADANAADGEGYVHFR